MSAIEVILVLLAGFAAGTINAVVGTGTLVTFPALLAVGYPPVVANVSNNLGLVPGAAASVIAYRLELRGRGRQILRYAPWTAAGAVVGAILLLELPEEAFRAIVPVLIAVSLVLVVLQPRISRWVTARRGEERPHGGPVLLGGILGTGVYGGYFGAGQGVLLFALLASSLDQDLRQVNAIRALLAGIANAVAGVVFILAADVAWEAVAVIAAGSIAGGWIGAGVGRRLPDPVLRAAIVVVGLAAMLQIML